MKEMLKPITITMNDTGEKYTLEFSRETVVFTNRQGFKRSELADNIEEMLPILFYGAFRLHHKTVGRNTTDAILFDVLKGLTDEVAARLLELYDAPRRALLLTEDEEIEEHEKNAGATVEL